jgi:hypothetical protein
MRAALLFLAIGLSSARAQSGAKLIDAPRIWNDRDLSDSATPVAGLNARPDHFSEKEYYSAPVGDVLRPSFLHRSSSSSIWQYSLA